ncbi:MAG: hypothetical protein AAB426_14695 [Myxococcota bacterium]
MSERPPRKPTQLKDDETTTVEPQPQARTRAGRRILGRLGTEDSVSLVSPMPTRKGRRMVPQGTAGLRAPPTASAESPKASEHRDSTRERVRHEREERRQRVWDKLDAAKRHADDRAPRLQSFEPQRGEGDPSDDDA